MNQSPLTENSWTSARVWMTRASSDWRTTAYGSVDVGSREECACAVMDGPVKRDIDAQPRERERADLGGAMRW